MQKKKGLQAEFAHFIPINKLKEPLCVISCASPRTGFFSLFLYSPLATAWSCSARIWYYNGTSTTLLRAT
jgi:hypothetical protein